MHTSFRSASHCLESQRYSATLHGNSSLLLIFATIQVSNFARHTRGDDVVCSEKGVHEGCFTMIYMANSCDIANDGCVGGVHYRELVVRGKVKDSGILCV